MREAKRRRVRALLTGAMAAVMLGFGGMVLALSQYDDDGEQPWLWDAGWAAVVAGMALAVSLIAVALWTLLTRR